MTLITAYFSDTTFVKGVFQLSMYIWKKWPKKQKI